MTNQLRLLFLMVVISGALCTVEDYVIMSQCAHNKAIHLAAEGTVSATDISQTQNITIVGLPDFVNNDFKIALYAKETQRYLCFNDHWKLVGMRELQDTCYFNETIVHGYFVFRSVVDLQRRIGFTQRGRAVGPKKIVNDACYMFTKIPTEQFFHQHPLFFAKTTASTRTTSLRPYYGGNRRKSQQIYDALSGGGGSGAGSGGGSGMGSSGGSGGNRGGGGGYNAGRSKPNRRKNPQNNSNFNNKNNNSNKQNANKKHSNKKQQQQQQTQRQQHHQAVHGSNKLKTNTEYNHTYLISSRQENKENLELSPAKHSNNNDSQHQQQQQQQHHHHHHHRHRHSHTHHTHHASVSSSNSSHLMHHHYGSSSSSSNDNTSLRQQHERKRKQHRVQQHRTKLMPAATEPSSTFETKTSTRINKLNLNQKQKPVSTQRTTTTAKQTTTSTALPALSGNKHKARRRKGDSGSGFGSLADSDSSSSQTQDKFHQEHMQKHEQLRLQHEREHILALETKYLKQHVDPVSKGSTLITTLPTSLYDNLESQAELEAEFNLSGSSNEFDELSGSATISNMETSLSESSLSAASIKPSKVEQQWYPSYHHSSSATTAFADISITAVNDDFYKSTVPEIYHNQLLATSREWLTPASTLQTDSTTAPTAIVTPILAENSKFSLDPLPTPTPLTLHRLANSWAKDFKQQHNHLDDDKSDNDDAQIYAFTTEYPNNFTNTDELQLTIAESAGSTEVAKDQRGVEDLTTTKDENYHSAISTLEVEKEELKERKQEQEQKRKQHSKQHDESLANIRKIPIPTNRAQDEVVTQNNNDGDDESLLTNTGLNNTKTNAAATAAVETADATTTTTTMTTSILTKSASESKTLTDYIYSYAAAAIGTSPILSPNTPPTTINSQPPASKSNESQSSYHHFQHQHQPTLPQANNSNAINQKPNKLTAVKEFDTDSSAATLLPLQHGQQDDFEQETTTILPHITTKLAETDVSQFGINNDFNSLPEQQVNQSQPQTITTAIRTSSTAETKNLATGGTSTTTILTTLPSTTTTTRSKILRKSTQKLMATPFHQLTYVRNDAGDSIDIDNIDNISLYPDIMENTSRDLEQLDANTSTKSIDSRLTMISGYLPTSSTAAILPESIRIAKIKINRERKRISSLRNVASLHNL